MGEGASQVD